jgi:hypothetical protein
MTYLTEAIPLHNSRTGEREGGRETVRWLARWRYHSIDEMMVGIREGLAAGREIAGAADGVV